MKSISSQFRRNFILELTGRCNYHCRYCYNIWKRDFPQPQEMDFEKWKNIIDIIERHNVNTIGLSGGEPLLYENWLEIVKYLGRKKIPCIIITNGSFLEKKTIKISLNYGVNTFEIPLLSATAKIHDWLTRKNGSWEISVRTIRNIKNLGGKVAAVYVGTKMNINNAASTLKLAVTLGADYLLFNYFNVGGEGCKFYDLLNPALADIEKTLTELDLLSEKYNFPISSAIPLPDCILDKSRYHNIKFATCQIGGRLPYYTISPDGSVRPCNHSRTILGNILTDDPALILENNIYREYADSFPKECEHCSSVQLCRGGCKAAAEVFYGNYHSLNPFVKKYLS